MGHAYIERRLNTNKLLRMVKEGLVTEEMVMGACLNYMSDEEVHEMMEWNEWDMD